MSRKPTLALFSLLFLLCCHTATLQAQQRGKAKAAPADTPAEKTPWVHNIFQQAWNSICRDPEEMCHDDPAYQVLNAKAEAMFLPFAGKYIRDVVIINLGFERNFADTSSRVRNLSTRIARTAHVNTKDFVIRNNLFQKEGQKVDAYIMADNERYLRTLDFLQDARILLRSVPGHPDSVDMLVVTKDVFSIKVVLDNDGTNSAKARVSESNFLGMGQRIQGTFLYSQTREPGFGYGFEYNKNNVCGSFAHLNIAYNNIDIGRSIGFLPEVSSAIAIHRPLPSPYDHFAGAVEFSTNQAVNMFGIADSLFYPYTYNIYDAWGGYNLSLNHIMRHDSSIRDRKFLSLRYFRQQFRNSPDYFETRFDPIYNNKEAILAQMTFFRQEFIKTQYIYGFGITEDVPYGYNISVTAGLWKQNNLQRPYAGITADYYTYEAKGAFNQYYVRAGAMKDGRRLNDATLMLGFHRFSRVYFSGTDVKIRPNYRLTYSRIFNPLIYEPLRLNNPYGIREFGSDSAQGYERISFQTEAVFFTRFAPYGFRLAPFIYADGAFMRAHNEQFYKSSFYPSFGGGLRTRNENLIFGTIEVKASYFPRPVDFQPRFKLLVASDLRYRYRTTYIHAPDIVRMNWDQW